MSLHPLNELKRKLDDDSTPLPKRLRLAKNVVNSHHFATTPKERIVADWLESLMKRNRLTSKDVREVLAWMNNTDDLTGELKIGLIKVVSQYLHSNPLQTEDIQYIVSFLENDKISPQLCSEIDNYLFIITTLLQHLRNENDKNLTERIFNNVVKYYRESKKKLEFIIKLLDGENLETMFSYLETECRGNVINFCQNVLFPITKKSFYASFLSNLIRKDNIDELIAEKGDNIQSVIKIMSAFFTFPKGRTGKDQQFLSDFINIFVSCFHSESQLIFAFYIMAASALNMTQSYMNPAMKMPPIMFDESDDKIKRNMFLNMLEVLHQNEVDVSIRLTDTLGEKIAKVEIKKNFTSFLQAVMMGQLKLEGKPDKTSLLIIKTALKLDPSVIEQKINQILPHLMTVKKSSSVLPSYIDTINCLLQILFKLSRGMDFITQILPHLKIGLEASNVEQFELKQKIAECVKNGEDCEKLKNKMLSGEDIFPKECVEMYGRLTSELMFRQNKDLLLSLQKDFEENCLMMLEEGFVSPSIITLADFLCAILCSFLRHNKMADHTIPLPIIEDFWATYENFEKVCLKKFGECILKLSYNPPLILSFLKLCLSFSQLKLLNIKYSNKKLVISSLTDQAELFDLSLLLPCLDCNQWMSVASKIVDDDAVLIMEKLLLAKTTALELLATTNFDDNNLSITMTTSHLIKEVCSKPEVIGNNDYYSKVLFTNLDKSQCKALAKSFVKYYLNNPTEDVLKKEGISNNKPLLQALVIETVRNITKCFENANSLSKGLNKTDFDMSSFTKDVNIEDFFKNMTIDINNHEEMISNCLDILKQLQIYYLEENYQLATIFVLLALKRCCQSKKMRRSIDNILQSKYELSAKYPDIYKLFPVNFIFSFENESLIDLLTLTIKTPNNLLIVKSILESAVKKVKTDSEIIKHIVDILLTKHRNKSSNISTIEYFNDPVFQINCIILPLIAKEKKAITTSAFRSILANLQEKLNQAMLDSFKNIDFSNNKSLCADTGNIDDSVALSNNTLAILNAMGAYTLTLLKCCETTDAGDVKNLDSLWSGLEFFVQNAIQAIENAESKSQHIESSVQLLNVTLRYIKKLETHDIFQKKDEIFQQIWKSIKARLLIVFGGKKKRLSTNCLEEIGVTLKFLSELSSVETFATFVGDLTVLSLLKKPSIILKNEKITNSQITAHKVSKYLWINCLKANIVGPKCVAMSKIMYKNCKNIKIWIQQHYDDVKNGENKVGNISMINEDDIMVMVVKVDDSICDLLRVDLDTLSEVILAAKKIPLDYKFLDAIFELQHLIHYIMGCNSIDRRCEISWQAFFSLFEGCYGVLNSLLLSREELLEDRWPCYMQCFKPLVLSLCERATSQAQLDRSVEEKLAETAHSIEKLTQSICKRKTHVSRISAYAVADFCSWLERTAPPKMVRQHLENSIALLIQASDSTYAMAFLKRALAGAAGQMTMSNMYTVYKRYHKYVGNA
ncbi:uncharacterized protein [Epargyreus clarus]|uniref:uncharacterized protein n=1 Tax=Epargyreus clarus TaxID=520877 RepID=UPI003C2C0AD2